MRSRRWLCGIALAALSTPAVQADEAASGPRIDEVIVTARKVEESAQDVPVSIAALSGADLLKGAVLNTQDLAVRVPGLQIFPSSQGGAPQFAIRAAKQDIGTSGGIAAYIDDVPLMSTWAIAKSLYDLESVSVLKGPQGTLFGVNATGGAVIFRPHRPTQTNEGYVQVGAGNYDYRQAQGMINLALNDMFQVRVAADVVRRDGFMKNITPKNGNSRMDDDDHESYRLSLMMRPSENLTNLLTADYYNEDGQPQVGKDRYFNEAVLGFIYPGNNISAVQSALGDRTVSIQRATFKKLTNWGAADTLTYTLDDNVTLKNVLGYRHDKNDTSEDWDGSQYPLVEGRTRYINKQITEELTAQITSDDQRLRAVAGVFFSKRDLQTDISGTTLQDSALSSNSIQQFERKFESVAVYSQFSYDLTDDITATLGGRYNWDKGDIDLTYRSEIPQLEGSFDLGHCLPGSSAYSTISFFPNFEPNRCSASFSEKWRAPSWTFTLENRINADTNLYFTTRRGYQAGGFNNLIREVQFQAYDPETVTDFELGVKSDWTLGGRPVRTNLAVFYGNYDDMQRSQNGQYLDPPGLYVAVFNAAGATFYGFDFEGSIFLTDDLDLSVSWSHVNAKYDQFQFPEVGITEAQDLSGFPLAQTPKDTVSWQLTYALPLPSSVGTVSAALSGFYRSSTTFSDTSQGAQFDFFNEQDAYSIYNATADWSGVFGSNVDIGLFVRNLTDKRYSINNNNQLGGLGVGWTFWSAPRTYGATLRYSF